MSTDHTAGLQRADRLGVIGWIGTLLVFVGRACASSSRMGPVAGEYTHIPAPGAGAGLHGGPVARHQHLLLRPRREIRHPVDDWRPGVRRHPRRRRPPGLSTQRALGPDLGPGPHLGIRAVAILRTWTRGEIHHVQSPRRRSTCTGTGWTPLPTQWREDHRRVHRCRDPAVSAQGEAPITALAPVIIEYTTTPRSHHHDQRRT